MPTAPEPRRRILALIGTGLSVAVAGCQAGAQGRGTPAYDCAEARRPDPTGPAQDDEAAVDPAPYPTPPAQLSDSRAVEFVEAYERAYRRNHLLERRGSRLRSWGMRVGESRRFDAPEGAAVVSLRYTYHAETDAEAEDSPVIYALYYVDDAVVVRAASDTGLDATTLLADAPYPDPWETGSPVECFG